MSAATYHVGDVFDVMATMPDESVDLVLTSPPFLALRSYLPDDHPDKAREIGSEPTPAEFLDTLLALTAGWDRLLAPHGSICVELGDTYSGAGGSGGDVDGSGKQTQHSRDTHASSDRRDGWPLAKSLCGIPTLYAWSLAYGRNLLTGEESPAGRWRIRNVVAWVRPNPPVGALGDKFRPATSYITVATKARDRWFDLDAVRNPDSDMTPGGSANSRQASGDTRGQSQQSRRAAKAPQPNPAGAPPLDWWEVTTEPYSGSHYATWPRKLLTRPIESMCPKEVCRTCGEPRRRITERSLETVERNRERRGGRSKDGRGDEHGIGGYGGFHAVAATTLGWTDCKHDDYRRGIVLDPFAGSGTTLAVATGLGRDAVGIDLDARNADLAAERVGMFLEVHRES